MASYAQGLLQTPSDERYNAFTSIWLARLLREYGPQGMLDIRVTLQERINQGDSDAHRELYYLYLYGQGGLVKDDKKARALLEELLVLEPISRRDEQFYLGTLLEEEGEHARAVRYYTQAAEMGHRIACATLAFIYSCGWKGMVETDARKTKEFAANALQKDGPVYPLPTHCMSMFANGLYVLKRGWFYDPVEALSYFALSNITQDCTRALGYLENAANGGLADAQKRLGELYLSGNSGCPKDVLCARYWLAQAAKQGNHEARDILFKIKSDELQVEPSTFLSRNHAKHLQRLKNMYLDLNTILEKQKKSPTAVFSKSRELVNNDTLHYYISYTKSRTAQSIKECLQAFQEAEIILGSAAYPNLQGIHKFAHAMALDNTYVKYCKLNIVGLLVPIASLKMLYPNDIILKYIHCFLNHGGRNCSPSFIRDLEQLVIEHSDEIAKGADQVKKDIMHDICYKLGALYFITNQYLRSADAFRKCRQFRPHVYEGMYGEAYSNLHKAMPELAEQERLDPTTMSRSLEDPEWLKAIQMLKEYIERSPPCARKRACVCLALAEQYIGKNHRLFVHYMDKFFEVDRARLPFFIRENSAKDYLLFAYPIYKMTLCFNDFCHTLQSEHSDEKLMRCTRCKTAVYCSKTCQREHYTKHKTECYAIAGICKK